MFRLQNNVPQVYVEQSRDFQLFCRVLDILQNGTKFDIDSIINVLDPFLANDRMLELLCTKVGFFPKHHYDAEILRHIIAVFPYAIKHKGSEAGIRAAVNSIIKAESVTSADSPNDVLIYIYREDDGGIVVNISAPYDIKNRNALNDVLSYILPAGCSVNYDVYLATSRVSMPVNTTDVTRRIFSSTDTQNQQIVNVSAVKNYWTDYVNSDEDVQQYQSSQVATVVVSKDIYDNSDEGEENPPL